jgi:SAM-dependent methyltransferase
VTAVAEQESGSAARNEEFFARDLYGEHVASLDTYRMIREAVTKEVSGTAKLLDVGNGGVFEYDTSQVGEIVAVDLFLDKLPADRFPANVTARRGDALALSEAEGAYDAVLEAFLFHHIVGATPADLLSNVRRALSEAERPLRPGGRLIVPESVVPRWFYALERVMFRPLLLLSRTPLLGGHPATMQLYTALLESLISERFEIERSYAIPTGRWLTQFGRKWPTALTPARPHMVIARKPA